MRDLELPGRSPAHAVSAMAATSHTLATAAAIDILRAGGNALDAAVAACAVQCVVEPESTGIGGDCFCLYAPGGSDEIVAYNGSGRAPAAATADWYRANGIDAIERQSPHAVTVPGAVDAWHRLVEDHGRLDLAQLLAPAVRYARGGYPIASRVGYDLAKQVESIRADPGMREVFLDAAGRTPAVGERHAQPALADTLERIGAEGRDAFYTGAVAEDIVETLAAGGGLHTLDDFRAAAGEYVEPISTEFRGHRVVECPPNGQGVIALLLLNVMGGFDPADHDPLGPERLHLEIEAGRLAYRDRNALVADPAMADVPVERMLSKAHADALRARIDPDRASAAPPVSVAAHADTVYITVVDAERNACSFINTLFNNLGSCIMAPRSGVVLHNRGQGFVLEPGHPNCIAPGKRPLHTIIPAMVTRDGRVTMSFGVMGGHYQAFGHMYFLTRLLDYGFDIQEAQDLPRFFPDPGTDEVQVEGGLPAAARAGLEARGHRLVAPPRPIGGSQAIHVDWERGLLTGGSDPRKDGCAIGY